MNEWEQGRTGTRSDLKKPLKNLDHFASSLLLQDQTAQAASGVNPSEPS